MSYHFNWRNLITDHKHDEHFCVDCLLSLVGADKLDAILDLLEDNLDEEQWFVATRIIEIVQEDRAEG